MARKIQISIEDIQRAKQLRDQATTIAEYRKALSVILSAELKQLSSCVSFADDRFFSAFSCAGYSCAG